MKTGEDREIHSFFTKRTCNSKTENDKEAGETITTEREEAGITSDREHVESAIEMR